MSILQNEIDRLRLEVARLQAVAAAEKKHADDVHAILNAIVHEAQAAAGRCPICVGKEAAA